MEKKPDYVNVADKGISKYNCTGFSIGEHK